MEQLPNTSRIANAVAALSPGRSTVRVFVPEDKPPDVKVVPKAERSRLAKKISDGEFVTSVEIVPPKGCDPSKMLEGVRLLNDAGVDAVNVPDGPRAQSRMGVLAVSTLIEQRVGIETVVHYCCRDRNLLGMTSDLLGAAGLGLKNLLIITGDPPKMGPYPEATAVLTSTPLACEYGQSLEPWSDIVATIGGPAAFFIGLA